MIVEMRPDRLSYLVEIDGRVYVRRSRFPSSRMEFLT